jgi:hypothetical protein
MVAPPFGTPLDMQADPRRLRALMEAGEAAYTNATDDAKQVEGARRIQIAATLGYAPARRLIVRDYVRARPLRSAVPAPDAVRYSLDAFTAVAIAPPRKLAPGVQRPPPGARREEYQLPAPELIAAFVALARYFAGRQEQAAYATHLVEAIRDDARLQIDRRIAPLFDALANVEGACAAVARNVAGQREAPVSGCGPEMRQRVIARARSARAVGREFESRRQALWLLDQIEGDASPTGPEPPRPAVRVLPGFPSVPAAGRAEPAAGTRPGD